MSQYERKVKYSNGKAVYRANGLYEVYSPPTGKYFTILDGIIWILLILAVIAIGKALINNLDVAIQYYQTFISLLG